MIQSMLSWTELFDSPQTCQRIFFSTEFVNLFPGDANGSFHVPTKLVWEITAEDNNVILILLGLLAFSQFVDLVSCGSCGHWLISRLDVHVITETLCENGNFFQMRTVDIMIKVDVCNDLHWFFLVDLVPLKLILFSLFMHALWVDLILPLFVAISSKDKCKDTII